LLLLTLFIVSVAKAQYSAQFNKYVNKGYKILDISKGDLNRDQYKNDVILILADINEDKENYYELDLKNRIVKILLQQATGYQLAAENKTCMLGKGDGGIKGDPYNGIAIKNGYFTLQYLGGSRDVWENYITFKYDGYRHWYLHKSTSIAYDSFAPNKVTARTDHTSKDFGKVLFEKFDPENKSY